MKIIKDNIREFVIALLILVIVVMGVFIIFGLENNQVDSSELSQSNDRDATDISLEAEQKGWRKANYGETGILNSNDDPSDCSGNIVVGASVEALYQLTAAIEANDDYARKQLQENNYIAGFKNCTEVLVLAKYGMFTQFRIIEDPTAVGWFPSAWVIRQEAPQDKG